MKRRRIPIFYSSLLSLAVSYFLITGGIPYASMWMTGKDYPLPVPSALVVIYMTLVIVGIYVYVTSREEWVEEFLQPLYGILREEQRGVHRWVRAVALGAVPLLAGWTVYSQAVPRGQPPTGLRIQHPTLPQQFERLENPFRNPDDETIRRFMAEEGKNLTLAEAREALVAKYTEEGNVLYQTYCRPCHGTKAEGEGPMALGLRLKPANFTDPGTIATVVESYAFWRVKEGGSGLPPESTPWDSAMPRWKDDLTDEQIWKIVLAEYQTAGVEPRSAEKLE